MREVTVATLWGVIVTVCVLCIMQLAVGCGAAQVTAETARATACQAAEQRVEDLHTDGTLDDPAAFQRIDCLRLACDAIRDELVPEEDR